MTKPRPPAVKTHAILRTVTLSFSFSKFKLIPPGLYDQIDFRKQLLIKINRNGKFSVFKNCSSVGEHYVGLILITTEIDEPIKIVLITSSKVAISLINIAGNTLISK